MTRVKSLRPTRVSVQSDGSESLDGKYHRVHRSKKGRRPGVVRKKELKRMLLERKAKFDKYV